MVFLLYVTRFCNHYIKVAVALRLDIGIRWCAVKRFKSTEIDSRLNSNFNVVIAKSVNIQ